MYHFVQALMERHAELRGREWFVVGESYGGHYAPATAHRILRGNAELRAAGRGGYRPVRLAGMAVGNGLTDSTLQYPAYPRMAHNYCRDAFGAPCVSAADRQTMEAALPDCQAAIAACNAAAAGSAAEEESCTAAFRLCAAVTAPYSATRRNPYDVRRFCDADSDLCYDFAHVEKFLNRPDVQRALGAREGTHWESCNMEVNGMFVLDFYKNFNASVVALLEAGVRVMIYAGDCDFICNWIGNKAWLQALRWSGHDAFAAAYDVPFRLEARRGVPREERIVGLVRAVAADQLPAAAAVNSTSPILLTFVQLFGAGHMVPMDQPAASRTMLHHFLRDEPFV
ncbi:cathepsin A (carboxypeptidase C) [Strigomonas culicis]|nr:cathepsin A (carboxypeptidase C) [Strigomonas culicis]|eukprot:EPY28297.1 cathepsin A (carboxypeptidase C) [Strigomonas culicis]